MSKETLKLEIEKMKLQKEINEQKHKNRMEEMKLKNELIEKSLDLKHNRRRDWFYKKDFNPSNHEHSQQGVETEVGSQETLSSNKISPYGDKPTDTEPSDESRAPVKDDAVSRIDEGSQFSKKSKSETEDKE